jgi:predicted DCC family thiol-disulfide oxidoreductase YuxK
MKHVILYDGVCVLCNRSVRFVLDRDPEGRFAFAPLQSDAAKERLARHGQTSSKLDSVYLLANYDQPDERVLNRGLAALRVMKELPSPWPLVAALLGVLPTAILNLGYDLVARTRYRVFGKLDSCPLPPAEHRQRFIDL